MSQESQSVRSVLGAELADIPVFRKVSRANLWKALFSSNYAANYLSDLLTAIVSVVFE